MRGQRLAFIAQSLCQICWL